MTGARITGVGVALPERELTNVEVGQIIGRDAAWIEARTGISSRRIAGEGETTAGLGIAAAERALDAAGLSGDQIDVIICATVTSDLRFPATACLIQAALDSRAAAFDLNAGCSGFLYALAQADAAVRSGMARRVLVVGAEVLSRITDANDPGTSILFGDGAGAVVVEVAGNGRPLGPFLLFSDGSNPGLLFVDDATDTMRMNGREVYRAAVAGMTDSVRRLFVSTGIGPDDVDLVIAHQANGRILAAVGDRLGLPPGKMFSNIARHGNTSSASIPIALAEAAETGVLENGDLVVLVAFGAGFVWGAGLIPWGPSGVAPHEATAKERVRA